MGPISQQINKSKLIKRHLGQHSQTLHMSAIGAFHGQLGMVAFPHISQRTKKSGLCRLGSILKVVLFALCAQTEKYQELVTLLTFS